jgi:peptidylprolyl isomerase
MSDERRRQQRRERQRRRTTNRPPAQPAPASTMHLPGVFGWVQRNGRIFALLGMVVLLLSLGGGFLMQTANSSNNTTTDPTPVPSMSTTPTPAPTPTFGPTGTPSPDGVFRIYADGPPPMTIDEHGQYQAVIHTEKGDIRIQLLPESAPEHVNNFVYLSEHHFYDGLTFHRVITNFVAQAGDPLGNSTGGPGYVLQPELNSLPMDAGVISMAAGSQGISGSQFFITTSAQPTLKDNGFAPFGRVTNGMSVVQSLTSRDPSKPNQPPGDRILGIDIIEGGN